MSLQGTLLGALAVAIGLTVGQPRDVGAAEWDCNYGGLCTYVAGCWGDWAQGFCYLQCYVEDPGGCGGNPGTCYVPAGTADCGRPT